MSYFHFILYNKWIDSCECSLCGYTYKCNNCLIISNRKKNLAINIEFDIIKCSECKKIY